MKPITTFYKHLNPLCNYCGDAATIIRITVTDDPEDIRVATMCMDDAIGEAESEGVAGMRRGVASHAEAAQSELGDEMTDTGKMTKAVAEIIEILGRMDPKEADRTIMAVLAFRAAMNEGGIQKLGEWLARATKDWNGKPIEVMK